MARTSTFSAIATLLVVTTLTGAAAAQGPKIGFVDIPFIIDRAPSAKAASARLEKEFAPRQQAIREKRADLKSKREQLEKDGLIMTADQRIELEREIRAIERKLRGEEQDFREELNIQKNNEFKKVRLSVMEAINQLAKEEEFDLILSDGVLFSSKRFDLTENILEQMQRSSEQQPAGN
ncbi:MAG: OmpH family outer membrane protein [Gammaproteobacteria bacterium]|nr:OmpH family outer membrane protein [Gammaproteobacteria bacterium]